MSSLYRRGNAWAIQFLDRNRRRKTLALGTVTKKAATQVQAHIDKLHAAHITMTTPPEESMRWLMGIDVRLRERIAAIGIAPAAVVTTLGPLWDRYLDAREGNVSPASMVRMRQAERLTIEHWGRDRPLSTITPGDAAGFRRALLARGMAEATVRKRSSDAKMVFAWAIDNHLIGLNPWANIPTSAVGNRSRQRMIGADDARRVMAGLPSAQWRLLFALARWGGLRVPSEPAALRWEDIRWDERRIVVTDAKNARHADRATRVIPLFPELAEPLQAVYDAAREGEPMVLPMLRGMAGATLFRAMRQSIKAAGLPVWPRLWHNLRATRQTELADLYPIQVVTAWIGNSRGVAERHYLQTTDEHFAKASTTATADVARGAARPVGV